MVTDPVCGMRIDPDDAAGSAVHDGERSWFCSDACLNAFVASPVTGVDRITAEELARRSVTTAERVTELIRLGILQPDDDGTFPRSGVMRARVVAYLQSMGIDAADLGRALDSKHLALGYLEAAGRQYPRSTRTYAERGEAIGLPFETLERLFVAFGLRPPQHDEPMREEDATILDAIGLLAGAGVAEADLLRLARVWGDGMRRIAQYLPHYFHEAVEGNFRERGLGDNQAYEAAINEVGVRIGQSGEDLLGWLFRRHSEAFMTAHQVDHVETALEEAGVRRRPPRTPEAAVFADLTGYTRLTEEAGDEAAADIALAFTQLVGEVASEHGGTIVKLLGDGVLLYFANPGNAVRASLELVERAPAQGLPPAHIGINAGPMLYDQGDYFGRTINVASRIAAVADAGRVLVGESVVQAVRLEGFAFSDAGRFELKGVAEPVVLHEAHRA